MNHDDQFKKELVNTYRRFIEASSVIFEKNFDLSNVESHLVEMAFEIEISARLRLADIESGFTATKERTSEYLNTTPKKCCATSARFLIYAVESFEKGEITDAFINFNEANKAILAAQSYFILEKRTASQAKGGKAKNAENNAMKAEAVAYYIANKSRFKSKKEAAKYIAMHVVPAKESTIEKRWLNKI